MLPSAAYLKEEKGTIYDEFVEFGYFLNFGKTPKTFDDKQVKEISSVKFEDLSVSLLGFGINGKDVNYCENCQRCFSIEKHNCEDPKIINLHLYNAFYTKGIKLDFKKYNLNTTQLYSLKNGILNSAEVLFGFGSQELGGIVLENESAIYIFDNYEGGTGYSYSIADNLYSIMKQLNETLSDPKDTCEIGCIKCLYSYWRKKDIKKIDKRTIIDFMKGFV